MQPRARAKATALPPPFAVPEMGFSINKLRAGRASPAGPRFQLDEARSTAW
ncbi:hypothetical protein [Lysobacter gummosus]|uniref:hypothetical protein n=1 Tax=Lysobacter gummosus TaxID=262324 RepID=UPI0036458CC5